MPVSDYLGEAAEASLQDLSWLAPKACRHDLVIEEVIQRHGPVLPVRFATLFSSLEKIERLLVFNELTIREFFEWLGNKREWAVKGVFEREAARKEAIPAALKNSLKAGGAGTNYLQTKRLHSEVDRQLSVTLKEVCRQAAAELQSLAPEFSERKVLSLASDSLEVILNWAFLVPDEAEPAFRLRVEGLATDKGLSGLHFVMTGPWAPYSFAPVLAESP